MLSVKLNTSIYQYSPTDVRGKDKPDRQLVFTVFVQLMRSSNIKLLNPAVEGFIISGWIVIYFLKDNSIEAVPDTWFLNGKCTWPKSLKTVRK
ncbi:Hypothetical protein CINCED_3A021382 [Cinara cedri]|uniref:Uncharacterized protein n=1 Tax=Cinara cedri TaxID=506608 RepID=A0A5E4M4E0_9HEMI|nr:Hypothetical protein CINCED_3A021382 [Cinara cedri]